MEAILQALLSFVLAYKYVAIFCISALAGFAVPIPAGTLLVASSFFSTQGYMYLPWVIISGILGYVVGDNAGYWVARHYGQSMLDKVGIGHLTRSVAFERVNGIFERYPRLTISATRFTNSLTVTANIVAGLTRMPYGRYLAFEALGESLYVFIACGVGYFFGSNWEYVQDIIQNITVVVTLAIILAIAVLWKKLPRRRRASEAVAQDEV